MILGLCAIGAMLQRKATADEPAASSAAEPAKTGRQDDAGASADSPTSESTTSDKTNDRPAKRPVATSQLAYHLKPELTYEYVFEMTTGADTKGPFHIKGNINYSLEPETSRTASVMEEARREHQAKSATSSMRVRYFAFANSQHSGRQETSSGTAAVTPRGDVTAIEGQADYNLIATSASRMIFERLPASGLHDWKSSRERIGGFVDQKIVGSPANPLSRYSGFSPAGSRSSFGRTWTYQQTVIDCVSVKDDIDYQLASISTDRAVIKTKFASVWTIGTKELLHIDGAGEVTFDRSQNMLSKGYAEYKLQAAENGVEVSVPFQLAFRLNDALTREQLNARVEKNRKDAEKLSEKTRADVAAWQAKRKTDADAKVKKALATLSDRSANSSTVSQALSDLVTAGIEPGNRDKLDSPRRKEIGKHLSRLLEGSDSSVQSQALRAAEYWATPDDIPALLAALKAAPNYGRSSIIRALAATGGNAEVAAVLVRLLETNSHYDATSALIAMKGCAKSTEPLVLPLLESSDSNLRRDACRILGEVGGAKSQVALDALLAKADRNDLIAFPAKQAREQIKARLAVQPE